MSTSLNLGISFQIYPYKLLFIILCDFVLCFRLENGGNLEARGRISMKIVGVSWWAWAIKILIFKVVGSEWVYSFLF